VSPRGAFPDGEEVASGAMFSASRADGKSITFRVVDASDELVLVDTNHPLAGETLYISIHVHRVRTATSDELYTGRAEPEYVQQPHYLA
jgi:FKBP-type peptidyl-prolyl cis-trans isomerase SlyD